MEQQRRKLHRPHVGARAAGREGGIEARTRLTELLLPREPVAPVRVRVRVRGIRLDRLPEEGLRRRVARVLAARSAAQCGFPSEVREQVGLARAGGGRRTGRQRRDQRLREGSRRLGWRPPGLEPRHRQIFLCGPHRESCTPGPGPPDEPGDGAAAIDHCRRALEAGPGGGEVAGPLLPIRRCLELAGLSIPITDLEKHLRRLVEAGENGDQDHQDANPLEGSVAGRARRLGGLAHVERRGCAACILARCTALRETIARGREKRNGAVVRDLTTDVTETGNVFVIAPAPASVKKAITVTAQLPKGVYAKPDAL